MKISRILKTILMIDFATGLLIAIKEVFKSKKTKSLLLKQPKLMKVEEKFSNLVSLVGQNDILVL